MLKYSCKSLNDFDGLFVIVSKRRFICPRHEGVMGSRSIAPPIFYVVVLSGQRYVLATLLPRKMAGAL